MADQEMAPEQEVEEAPEAGPEGFSQEDVAKITDDLSKRAVEVVNRMQELGFVLSKLGIPKEQLQELAGTFEAFVQTLQGILGGEAPAEGEAPEAAEGPAPDKGNQPVDMESGGNGVPVM
jgi:hypothetical protein